MELRIDRRRFLQSASLAGVGYPALGPFLSDAAFGDAASQASFHANAAKLNAVSKLEQMENQFFKIGFDTDTGRFHVLRSKEAPFLQSALSRVVAANGSRSSTDAEYKRSVEVSAVRDPLGAGTQLLARCTDQHRQLDLEIHLILYEGSDAFLVETVCHNVSKDPILVSGLEPVRAVMDEGAGCYWTARKALTNGYIYYDPGQLQDFLLSSLRGTRSMWNIAFYNGDQEEGLVVGFLENRAAEGHLSAWHDGTIRPWGVFALIAEAFLNRVFVLKPGASRSSGRVMFQFAPDTFAALESYAQAVATVHQVKLNPIINGWCSWFYTNRNIDEGEQLKNAKFIAEHLKPYGMEWVQIDAGYQRALGDWEAHANFPHGMKWMADRIRELGLKPGLWVAPFAISASTDLAQKHPEWLAHDSEGNLQVVTTLQNYTPWISGPVYALDITHPEARQWLYDLFRRITHDWGYDFIKIDFVEWTILAISRYHDPTVSRAQAYRLGVETIRSAIGPDRHLLDCGPGSETVGLIDSMRIEQDTPPLDWHQFTKPFNGSAPAMAKRYYFNRKAWINDADHLGLSLLTMSEAQAAATIIALSGGTVISSDRLYELDPTRLEILKKVLPSFGQAARPVDLFERDEPAIFSLPIRTEFEQWTILGLFNYDEHATANRQVSLKQLRLDPSKAHLAYEFWSQSFLGEVQGSVSATLGPGSIALIALREKQGVPQVLSTDRHFTQGALELKRVEWDTASKSLRGISLGPAGTHHSIVIYVPEQFVWDRKTSFTPPNPRFHFFHDYDGYSVRMNDPNLLTLHVRFENTEQVEWQLKFKSVT